MDKTEVQCNYLSKGQINVNTLYKYIYCIYLTNGIKIQMLRR